VAVRQRPPVSLRMKRKKIIFFHISSETTRVVTVTVAAFDVPPQGLSRNVKYCSTLVHFMLTAKFVCFFVSQRMYDMNERYQMQEGKNWILPKETM
jgi:hypothetical protein